MHCHFCAPVSKFVKVQQQLQIEFALTSVQVHQKSFVKKKGNSSGQLCRGLWNWSGDKALVIERQHQDDSTFFLFASVTQGSDKSNNLTPPPPSPSQLRSKMRVPKAESSPSGAWSLLKQVQSHIGLTITWIPLEI